jgi:hypothetical protein
MAVAVFEEFKKLIPAVPVSSAAVPRTAFPLLVSRKDTVPVGYSNPPVPVTVAVIV